MNRTYNTIQYKTFVDRLNFVMETIHKPGKSCEIKQLGMPDRIKMFLTVYQISKLYLNS